MVERDFNFSESVVFGLGSGTGWALAIVGLAGIREKIEIQQRATCIARAGHYIYDRGLMAMAFMLFSGIQL